MPRVSVVQRTDVPVAGPRKVHDNRSIKQALIVQPGNSKSKPKKKNKNLYYIVNSACQWEHTNFIEAIGVMFLTRALGFD